MSGIFKGLKFLILLLLYQLLIPAYGASLMYTGQGLEPLDGAVIDGSETISVVRDQGDPQIRFVRFRIDRAIRQTDREAPFELSEAFHTFDDGNHNVLAVIRYENGRRERLRASFEVTIHTIDDGDDGPPVTPPDSPNIVLILADDMGYSDLGSYGSEIETPNLDRLADNGMRFTNFYNAAKCQQSRATLMSGLYHHQTVGQNGNRARLMAAKNHVTIAEALRRGGYRTMISGKWGLIGSPLDRGFDRFFGFGMEAVDYFTGEAYLNSGANVMKLDRNEFEIPENGYYLTDAITDYAIEFVDEAVALEQPFFLFVNHFAPHFPLQAPAADIERYRGKYMMGWDHLREQRLERMRELGVVDPSWPLSPRDKNMVPNWNSLSLSEQQEQDLLMAVYAAMIDRMDQNIGRLFAHLDERGLTHNTLIIYLSDNGGNNLPWDVTPDLKPGPARHYRGIEYWYNLSNTPFRRHKGNANEGGISTPAIAHWPAAINQYGSITDTVAHFVDLMPTLLDVAGIDYPKNYDGHDVLPMEGISFKPVLIGNGPARTEEPLYWEHKGRRGVRIGSYKLVANKGSPWALHDLQSDRVELIDMIEADPSQATTMQRLFERWADRVGVP